MTTTTQEMEKKQKGFPGAVMIASLVLALAGLGAWIYQLTQGMEVTGLGNQVVWGLYIAGFFTAVGGGAGLLSLVGLSEFVDELQVVKRARALSLAVIAFVAAGVLIMMDLGSPVKVWQMVIAAEFSSLMTWDFWLLLAAGVVAVIYLLQAGEEGRKPVLGVLAVAVSAAVVAVEGWMLSVLAARPMWGGGLTVFSFLLSALAAGLGLALLITTEKETVVKWLKLALIANLVLVLAEVLTGLIAGGEEMVLVLAGSAAPEFWLHLVVGLALPLALLLAGQGLSAAGGLVVIGVLAEKVWMLEAGQAFPWLELPEGSYAASWVEYLALVGVIALSVLLYTLARNLELTGENE